MTALNQDQRFAFLLIISLMGSFILGISEAQTFTAEDRNSIQKFMDQLISFLELESSNVTTTLAPSSNATSVETSTLSSGNSTQVTTEVARTTGNSTSSVLSTSSTTSTTSTTRFNSTTVGNTTSTTESNPTTIRRRICFKRFCYKFSNDKGYIV
ncbi:cell wall integrity and stress response component 3 [Drosophila rhopaloa]|uniref:Cell wall integrity and stress response component 3 n=1 Tax=Drosophila rhopaloa TaxID=1041015 RepID=A0A6P4EPJ5_DRORH|nr:cell wall integrity and stress response component 3 [Drosophila rhopaloa]